MAPKRPLGNPPPASSSDDEEEDPSEDDEEMEEAQQPEQVVEEEESEEGEEVDDDDDEEEDSEEEEPQMKQSVTMKEQVSNVDEEESGSDDDSDEETQKVSTPISKKRVLETPTQMLETSAKKATGSVGAPSFQRIWSDEDVITILEAMIAFKEDKGAEPSPAEMPDFYESIKDSLHIQVSRVQLSHKFKTLKKKYQNNAKRGQDGEDPVFSKPHEYQTFQLSKLIWGDATSNGNVVETARKSNKTVKTDQSFEELLAARIEADDFWANYPSLNQYKYLLPEKMRSMIPLVRRTKVKEMDEKWQKFNKRELELAMKKTQLFLDMSKAMGFGQGN